jgi:hypothetical protein
MGRHLGRGIALQQAQQVVDLRDVLRRHLGDVGAAAHLHRHQALRGQHLQRLAQRRVPSMPNSAHRRISCNCKLRLEHAVKVRARSRSATSS